MTIAYISIGSNLNSPLIQVNSALVALNKIPETYVISVSNYYRTEPLGQLNQPDYLNAAVKLLTNLDPYKLLEYIQYIELQQGRRREGIKWSSRSIDLDLMIFGNEIINTPRLIVPHYDIQNRGCMLWPLIEVAPKLHIPNGMSLQTAIEKLGTKKPFLW